MNAVLDDVLPVYRHRERHATPIVAPPVDASCRSGDPVRNDRLESEVPDGDRKLR